MAGTEMMRVARLDQMEVEVEVNENEIVNVALGDTASIDVDAYPERPFKGIVTEIANSARTLGAGTQEQVTNFPVKVRIVNDQNANAGADQVIAQSEVPLPTAGSFIFRPGMSATVDIFTETVMNIVGVPIQAVTVRDFNKVKQKDEATDTDTTTAKSDKEDLRKVVFIVAEGKAEMVEVETGISDDTYIEIRSGLSGGEKVVTGPYRAVSRTLEPAEEVKVEDEEKKEPGVTTASDS
jgi:HlyD family secretion protein